jgi:hypothetical protein
MLAGLSWVRRWPWENPCDHLFEGGEPERMFVQTWDQAKFFAAGFEEQFSSPHPDLFDCLQAVGDKRGAHDQHLPFALLP